MIGEVSFVVAGSGYRNRKLLAAAARASAVGEAVRLVREPSNLYDPNAVQVWIEPDGERKAFLGYVPRDLAGRIASAIDKGGEVRCLLDAVLVDPNDDFDPIRFRIKVSA